MCPPKVASIPETARTVLDARDGEMKERTDSERWRFVRCIGAALSQFANGTEENERMREKEGECTG